MEILKPAIQKVVQDHPAWDVRKVWALLRSEGSRASQKPIDSLMHGLGLLLPVSGVARGHVGVPNSSRRWATDLTTV